MNMLLESYPQEIAQILSKYPPEQKRSAVMPLLYLAQRKSGYITRQSINEVADITGTSPTDVASVVGFYTLYHEGEGPRYRLQVCTDLSCALSAKAPLASEELITVWFVGNADGSSPIMSAACIVEVS